jgi:tyrosine-protein kinase Etk/Wzc
MTTPDTQRRWIDLALLLAARGRLLAATAAAGAVCATAVALILPPAYLARTTILPPQQSQSLAPAMMGQLGALAALGGRDLGLRNTADLYAGIVQSDNIAAELITKFGLAERYGAKRLSDAQRTLARRTAVTVRPKEGLIDIEVQDSDPKVAAQMANAYVELLFTANARLALTEASQRRLFFEEQLRAAKANLAEAEAAMKRTQQSTGMLQLDSQAKAIVQAVSGIKAEIAAKEVQLRAMNAFAADRNPDVIVAREELAGLQSQLARMQSRGGGPGDVEIATRRMPETSLAYIRSLRELAFQEALYELLAKQYEAARIDEAKSAPVIQVVDRAQPPDHRSGPPRLLIVAAATFVCLLAAVLLLIVEDRFRHAAADPDTARKLAIFRSYLIFGSAR